MKRLAFFAVCLLVQGTLFAEETPVHWEYFEPGIDYTRRLRVTAATTGWEIVSEPAPDTSGKSLKLTFDFSKSNRQGVLVFDLPLLAFDRIRFRIWNPNPSTIPIYIHLSAFQATSIGAFKESISFVTRYYGDPVDAPVTPEMKSHFLNPSKPSSPLPDSRDAGWIVYEALLPRDIVDVVANGAHRPLNPAEESGWKKFALPTIAVMFETTPKAFGKGPVSLYLDDFELFLSK